MDVDRTVHACAKQGWPAAFPADAPRFATRSPAHREITTIRSGGLVDLIRAVQLRPMLFREGHVGEHIRLRVVHDGGELRNLGADLVGDGAPLQARGFRVRQASPCAKAVAMKAETTRRPLLPACASTFLMK